MIEIVIFLCVGFLTGIISGLFGLGGGVIVVPCLATIFALHHVAPSFIMHLSVGTSLAVMVGTTANSSYQHSKKNQGYFDLYSRLFVGIIFGVLIGSMVGHYLHGHVLQMIFGVLILFVGLNMLRPVSIELSKERQLPGSYVMHGVATFIGFICALLGVGGGFITVPFLTHYGVKLHLAIMVSALLALTVGVLGTVASIYWGWGFTALPEGSTGYVYWPACLAIMVGSIFAVPLGAKLAYRLPEKILKRCFAVILLVIGLHMLF